MSEPSTPPQRLRTYLPQARPLRVISRFLSGILDRLRPSVMTLLLITAIGVGAATGLAAVLFIKLIDWVTQLSFRDLPALLPALGPYWLLVIPAVGGLLGGPIIAKFALEAKGHGVPEVMQALALNRGRIRPRVAVAKIVASSLCLGTGGSAGREGPIVQVGSTIGSVLGQLFRLSENRIRNLVACGAAAGVAATFNAPIAGVAFAIEVLAGDLGLSILSNVVMASVTASVVSQALLGSHHAFDAPTYRLNSPVELILYLVLGFLAALAGIAFIRTLYASEDLFDRWRRVPRWLKPAIGGLLLGGVALLYTAILRYHPDVGPELARDGFPLYPDRLPHVFGSGFSSIEMALGGPLPWVLLLSLVLLKMLATSLTLGSGNSGGVFAPSLFMGAMLGGLFGVGADAVFPDLVVNEGAYALAGMAAVFAGAARAPLTAILIAFEMSDDYAFILPLMATTITAAMVASRLHPESIYTLKLVRRGIHLRQGRDIDVMDGVLVGEIMNAQPQTVAPEMHLKELETFFVENHRHGAPVVDGEGNLLGIVTLQDLSTGKREEDWERLDVGAIMIRTVLTVFPDETMGAALQRMAVRDVGRLPVVDRKNPRQLVGIIRRVDIGRAYRRGLLRLEELHQRATRQRITRSTETEFLEIEVRGSSRAAGRHVRDLPLPGGVLLTTRRRGSTRQILHGEDILEPGDIIQAVAEQGAVSELRKIFE